MNSGEGRHSQSHEMTAFYNYVYAALSIPMNNTNLNNELNIIKLMVTDNGYRASIMDNCIRKHKLKTTKT